MANIILKVPYVEKRKLIEKEFEIFIVPNRFTVDISDYFQKQRQILEITKKLSEAKTIEEVQAVEKSIDIQELEKTLKMKYDLIKTIMIANDYEFEQEWWDTRVDPKAIEEFIVSCSLKDKTTDGKKKELLKMMGL